MNSRLLNVRRRWRSRAALVAAPAFVAGLVAPGCASAQSTYTGCWKITGTTSTASSYLYTDPGSVVANWTGSTDTAGQGAFPMTINVSVPALVPDGTLLGSGISPIYNLGANGVGSYSPEQILFRCSRNADGTIYEYYATNGDSTNAGMTDVSAQSGIPGTYRAYYAGVISRVTNMATGDVLTRYWQPRSRQRGMDPREGEKFQPVQAGVVSVHSLSCRRYQQDRKLGRNAATRLRRLRRRSYRQHQCHPGQPGRRRRRGNELRRLVWHLARRDQRVRHGDCEKSRHLRRHQYNAGGDIPPVTAAELNRGGTRQAPVTIQMPCQSTAPSGMSAFVSGTAASQTALGVLVPPANAQSAVNAGLTTSGTGVTYLLSDGYGTDPGN